MVPAVDGRTGSRTAVDSHWYGLGMLSTRTGPIRTIGITFLIAMMVVAGCLPPPGPTGPSVAAPSVATGSVAPSPSGAAPSPSARPEDAAIAAFARQVATGKLTYHVAFTGEVRAAADRVPIAGAMDVAGNDFASSFTYDFEPGYPGLGKVRVQVRGVDTHGWIKRGSANWAVLKTYGLGQSYVPFKSVAAATDVKYLGPVKIAGRTYYKIEVRDALLIHPNTIPYQIQKEEVRETQLQVVIDDTGTPRSGSWTLLGQARVGAGEGQLQHVEYDLQLTFSNVGGKISVRRP
jgi:hypothetical protein